MPRAGALRQHDCLSVPLAENRSKTCLKEIGITMSHLRSCLCEAARESDRNGWCQPSLLASGQHNGKTPDAVRMQGSREDLGDGAQLRVDISRSWLGDNPESLNGSDSESVAGVSWPQSTSGLSEQPSEGAAGCARRKKKKVRALSARPPSIRKIHSTSHHDLLRVRIQIDYSHLLIISQEDKKILIWQLIFT